MSNPTFKETVNVVVLIALPEEYDIFTRMFPQIDDISTTTLVRLRHDFGVSGHSLVSVLAEGMGSDYAASAASSSIEDLSPDLIVCLGIAGSLSNDVQLGDVCVSSEIIDVLHNSKIGDIGKSAKGSRQQLSPRNYAVLPSLQSSCRFLRSHPNLKPNFQKWISECDEHRKALTSFVDLGVTEQNFHVGPIVCGPVSISKSFNDQLKLINRKVLAIETESGGIFRVCSDRGIPGFTIRGISDRADSTKAQLETSSRLQYRRLAMENASAFFRLQCCNLAFMSVAVDHARQRQSGLTAVSKVSPPLDILKDTASLIDKTLASLSAEYKNRPSEAPLPLPRIRKISASDDLTLDEANRPISVFDAISEDRVVFLKIPRSFPDQSLAWSIAQSLLKYDLNGKQVLPMVLMGSQITPPNRGITHSLIQDITNTEIQQDFSPILIISEPPFESRTRINFLVQEIAGLPSSYILILSKAETPLETIEQFKSDLGAADYLSASVPFAEIATYLEQAFEMAPAEADVVATRLDDTFSKFRLHTHPAYFIGLQESTLSALINANQRAELIQLAVDGLLSFVVATDKSVVKLSRTTREEYLASLAFCMRVEGIDFCRSDLVRHIESFCKRKALEVDAIEFARGFFVVGLLNEISGKISFSLSFLESYLLSDVLLGLPDKAVDYFNPDLEDFDSYTYDLYCEKGAHSNVIANVVAYAQRAMCDCSHDENVFCGVIIKPHALATVEVLVSVAKGLGAAAEKMTADPSSLKVRLEKQRLIDAREAVQSRVGKRREAISSELSSETVSEFELLDRLSRAMTLLATLIGSGSERLDGDIKAGLGQALLSISERFLHLWTLNRLKIDFWQIRQEIATGEIVDNIIQQLDLLDDDREGITESLMLFVDDQQMKALSGPLALVLHRLASHAGIRSLKPVVTKLKPKNVIEDVLRSAWLMDVDPADGRRAIKGALRSYKGAPLLRLVLANHFMWRIFWHHWQTNSRTQFADAAKLTLRPMGLSTPKETEQRILAGHQAAI